MEFLRNAIRRVIRMFGPRRAVPFRMRGYYHPTEQSRWGRTVHRSWADRFGIDSEDI